MLRSGSPPINGAWPAPCLAPRAAPVDDVFGGPSSTACEESPRGYVIIFTLHGHYAGWSTRMPFASTSECNMPVPPERSCEPARVALDACCKTWPNVVSPQYSDQLIDLVNDALQSRWLGPQHRVEASEEMRGKACLKDSWAMHRSSRDDRCSQLLR